jgi:hypothetical protein
VPVPPDHRVRRDDDQVPPPVAAHTADEHPEQFVQAPPADASPRPCQPGKEHQLVAKQEVLQYEVAASATGGTQRHQHEQQEVEHPRSMSHGVPRGHARRYAVPQVVTDTLASYPPALKRVLPDTEHRRHKGLNNRAEVAWSQRTTFA